MFREVLNRAQVGSSISDYLPKIFCESPLVEPNTIVKLGVRGGESTFVFERVARMSNADLVSVDLNDCSDVIDYDGWHFVQGDDIEFAREFETWCSEHEVVPDVDVLFIDTSHLYEHTVNEIHRWFPHLSEQAIVFFHDTNLTRYFRRKDGTAGRGWDNDRGVIRALEQYFDCAFEETKPFVTIQRNFIIDHAPQSAGLTIIHKHTKAV